MITKIELSNFKRFRETSVTLSPATTTLLVGANNQGKSTLLHALALWQFAKTVMTFYKGERAILQGINCDGYGVSFDEFTPLNIPSFRHLWTNLKSSGSYSLKIKVFWNDDHGMEKYLQIGFSLNLALLYMKSLDTNLVMGDKTPNIAYLPTFAGISNKEQWYAKAQRDMMIGKGLAGSVLRNQIMTLFNENEKIRNERRDARGNLSRADREYIIETDSYEILNRVLQRTFKGVLYTKPFNPEFNTTIQVNFKKGKYVGNRFEPLREYEERDIMVEGSGFLQWLSVYTFALSKNIDVLLLDEPDAHLHASLQGTLIKELDDISRKNNKQVLLATHSPEVIKSFDYERILYVEGTSIRYMSDKSCKVKVLSGIGTEYFPLIEEITSKKRLLLVENDSDARYLQIFCDKVGHWPADNIAVWPRADKFTERIHLYEYLRMQIPDIKCLSLNDRDNHEYNDITERLHIKSSSDIINGTSVFLKRMWRRHEMESYLLCPPAIRRMIIANNQGKTEAEVTTELSDFVQNALGIVINESTYRNSERTPQIAPLFDLDAKTILHPILNHFHINKYKLAEEIRLDEMHEDVICLCREIIGLIDRHESTE